MRNNSFEYIVGGLIILSMSFFWLMLGSEFVWIFLADLALGIIIVGVGIRETNKNIKNEPRSTGSNATNRG